MFYYVFTERILFVNILNVKEINVHYSKHDVDNRPSVAKREHTLMSMYVVQYHCALKGHS